ncbi:MAG TPA: glycosyltransferase family 87 protein [Chloroflexia bacterium]|nr:glycosyltransferase family 87 protein [Chloroflexia bacterium]
MTINDRENGKASRQLLTLPANRAFLWAGGFLVVLLLFLQAGPTLGVHNDFTQNVWMPSRMLLNGANPYQPTEGEVSQALGEYTSEFSSFNGGSSYFSIYPIWVAILFLPLGAMPLIFATAVWRAANLLLMVWAVGSILRSSNPAFRTGKQAAAAVTMLVAICIVFRQSINTLVGGQFAIIELGLLAAVWGWLISSAGKARQLTLTGDILAGVALALLATKPQSSGLAVALVGLWALIRRRYAIPASAAVIFLLLLGLPSLIYPHSVPEWTAIVFGGQAGSQAEVSASVWGVNYALLGATSFWRWAALAMSAVGLLLLLPFWRDDLKGKASPVPLALPVTLCVNSIISPYLLGYEQVLLLFPAVVMVAGIGIASDGAGSLARARLRAALFVWIGLLPLVLVPIQMLMKAEYPLVVQSATMLVMCLLVRFNWIDNAKGAQQVALPV